ncbi:right-handed parallel beta-helix repeat-containing protein, partial [Patescibacteria group bacterium]|nr:right-handed parallel beta-helix repeat-containing protein [Patescibacteria group bacterium]
MLKINKTIIFSFVFSFFIFIPILTNAQIIETVIPGTTEGEGKHFEITNSAYLNITLDSSESIKLRMESIPKMITIMIESISSAQSAEIILSGLAPLTTYYKYQDDYHNLETFTTDENGDYTYPQDLSVPHFIFIQTQKSTKFIKDDASGGDCNLIGTWDATKKTCTLNADLNETIQIDSDNITLDGDGHEISGGNTGFGVYFQEKFGITIKNTTLKNFSKGISFRYSYQNILNNNSISNTYEGINGWYSANNTLSKNKFLSNNDGICLYYSDNNNLSDNIILNNNYDGVGFYNSSNNTFVGNTVSNNHYSGMGLYTSNANTIIDNIILNNGSDGLSFYDSAE